jgi:cell division protein FtsL
VKGFFSRVKKVLFTTFCPVFMGLSMVFIFMVCGGFFHRQAGIAPMPGG